MNEYLSSFKVAQYVVREEDGVVSRSLCPAATPPHLFKTDPFKKPWLPVSPEWLCLLNFHGPTRRAWVLIILSATFPLKLGPP